MIKKARVLRPGVTNPSLWHPERPPKSEWDRIRKFVLERDNWTCVFCGHSAHKWMNIHHLEDSASIKPDDLAPVCVACHAVLHIGLNLMHGIIEIWECDTPQVDIVRHTRAGIIRGLSHDEIKSHLSLRPGPRPPSSIQYANDLVAMMSDLPRAYLSEPLSAVFINLKRWQIES